MTEESREYEILVKNVQNHESKFYKIITTKEKDYDNITFRHGKLICKKCGVDVTITDHISCSNCSWSFSN